MRTVKKITLAKSAGFCYGVRRAVDMAYSLLEQGKRLRTLGALIHNPQVVRSLEEQGSVVIENPQEARQGDTVLIRAHGISPAVKRCLEESGAAIADATCPYVAKIHRIVERETADGTPLYLLGDKSHPEVVGILGYSKSPAFVYSDHKELEKIFSENNQKNGLFVQQTTANEEIWLECKKRLKKLLTNGRIFDTICGATLERQREAAHLARKCSAMVVIGGEESANTRQLAAVCRLYCPVFCIEKTDQLAYFDLPQTGTIGVTAGASTPASIIEEVVTTMTEENKIIEENTMESQAEFLPEEAVVDNIAAVAAVEEAAETQTAPEETAQTAAEDAGETEESQEKPRREITDDMGFEEALDISLENQSMTSKVVLGIVTGVFPGEIRVDLVGRKQAGYISADEYSSDRAVNHMEEVKVGDELDLIIMKTDDNEGMIMCSKRRYDSVAGWNSVKKAYKEKAILEGVVSEIIKGGLLIYVSGVRVFVPASLASDRRSEPLEDLLGQNVKFKVIEAGLNDRKHRKVVGSIREANLAARKEKAAKFWETAEEGNVYTGRVRTTTSFGAFVDLGGIDGLIHITQLSWTRVDKASDIVKPGQEVEVYIKKLDPEKKKISLGYRKEEDSPWNIFTAQYGIGDVISVEIVSMTTFGAFASVIPGVQGLIHISQISDKRIDKPQDELKVGQTVQVKILDIDADTKRVSLSIRALLEDGSDGEDGVSSGDALVYSDDAGITAEDYVGDDLPPEEPPAEAAQEVPIEVAQEIPAEEKAQEAPVEETPVAE